MAAIGKFRSQLAEAAAKAKEEAAYVFSEELAKAKELRAATAKLKEVASSSIDSAKQRVASNVETSSASLGSFMSSYTTSYLLGSHARGGDVGGTYNDVAANDVATLGGEPPGDEATAEKERLVDGGGCPSMENKLRTGLTAASQVWRSESNWGKARATTVALGMSSLSLSREDVVSLVGSAKALGSQTLDGVRSAGERGMNSGMSGLRIAKEAGSSGADRLRAAKEATQERCGDALSAASAVSGVSLRRKEEGQLDHLCRCCPALSYKQRLLGVACCMLAGLLLALSSLLSLTQLMLGNPLPFAFKYTAGNCLSLGSTTFLVGPMRQVRDMLAPSRRAASLVYVGSLVCSLSSVLLLRLAPLSLLFIVLQMIALAWYTLSYVPYGQAAARSFLRRMFKRAANPLLGGVGGLSPVGLHPPRTVADESSANDI